MASLFSACKSAVRNNSGGTFNIGGYDIDIEYYGQQDIDDDFRFGNVAFGDEDESKILLVAGSTITIPEGYTFTPDSPKKSLVIFCNNLVNNGTISMYQKAPNVLPHDYFIIEKTYFDSNKDLVIPAYANNGSTNGGTNGTNRNCGSGGTGNCNNSGDGVIRKNPYGVSGQGYAFGGGAGVAGILHRGTSMDESGRSYFESVAPSTTYPMRGGVPTRTPGEGYYSATGGAGNPYGGNIYGGYGGTNFETFFGCGGRVIIFCVNFTNNGIINVNGTNTKTYSGSNAYGGASGAGAVDLFYTTLNEQGTITANGGTSSYDYGKGGNGSITLSQWSQTKLFKTEVKYFSQANVAYLLTQLSDRIKDSRMGE